MKNILIGLMLLLGTSVANTHADILVEPYLGYYVGKYEIAPTDGDYTGIGFGGRLGYQSMGLMLGLDYMTGMFDADTTPSADVTPRDLGFFVGYDFPVMLRVYGVYIFDSKADFETTSTNTYKGNGMKFGVGLTMLPLVSINLEYITHEFDEDDSGTVSPKLETKNYGVNISLPLTF